MFAVALVDQNGLNPLGGLNVCVARFDVKVTAGAVQDRPLAVFLVEQRGAGPHDRRYAQRARNERSFAWNPGRSVTSLLTEYRGICP